jgi:hypothetical protein
MRIQSTDQREREWRALQKATGENTKSGAIDTAVRFYLAMHGDNAVDPTGRLPALLEAAEDQGCLTVPEIAEILDTDELPVAAEVSWSIHPE